MLSYVYKQYYGTGGGGALASQLQAAVDVIGEKSDKGLRKQGLVVSGYSFKPEAYTIESAMSSRFASVLRSEGYNVVMTKSGSSNGEDFISKTNSATAAGASLHLVIWSRKVSGSEGTGWEFIYNDSSAGTEKAKSFANAAADALQGKTVKTMYDGDNDDRTQPVMSTGNFAQKVDMYTILNYGDVPTVLLIVGDYSSDDYKDKLKETAVQAEFADAVKAGVKALK